MKTDRTTKQKFATREIHEGTGPDQRWFGGGQLNVAATVIMREKVFSKTSAKIMFGVFVWIDHAV